jgi:putative ABC transport system ATP-binding protein
VLEIRRACKTFNPGTPNAVPALRGLDLSMEAGEFAVVVGGNGSGKSTLLNAIAGSFLLDEGTIRLGGEDITSWPEHRRARRIGRVFQNPFQGTAPNLTVAENLALASRRGLTRGLGRTLAPGFRKAMQDRVAGLRLGLEDRLDQPTGTLSGGQRQALTLVMASWLRPDLLLLDEHTAALDPKSAEQVLRLTETVVSGGKLTTLMVTHSMLQAANLGDRLVMMAQGRAVFDFRGAEKRRLRVDDLLARFEEVRRSEQLDETAAVLIRNAYA